MRPPLKQGRPPLTWVKMFRAVCTGRGFLFPPFSGWGGQIKRLTWGFSGSVYWGAVIKSEAWNSLLILFLSLCPRMGCLLVLGLWGPRFLWCLKEGCIGSVFSSLTQSQRLPCSLEKEGRDERNSYLIQGHQPPCSVHPAPTPCTPSRPLQLLSIKSLSLLCFLTLKKHRLD